MNIDTPETDKAEYTVRLGTHKRKVVRPELSRRLERERNQARQERDELRDALEHASAFVVTFTMAVPSLANITMAYSIADTGEKGEITPKQIIEMSHKALEKLAAKGVSDE